MISSPLFSILLLNISQTHTSIPLLLLTTLSIYRELSLLSNCYYWGIRWRTASTSATTSQAKGNRSCRRIWPDASLSASNKPLLKGTVIYEMDIRTLSFWHISAGRFYIVDCRKVSFFSEIWAGYKRKFKQNLREPFADKDCTTIVIVMRFLSHTIYRFATFSMCRMPVSCRNRLSIVYFFSEFGIHEEDATVTEAAHEIDITILLSSLCKLLFLV